MFKPTTALLAILFLAATITTVSAEDPPTSCEPNYWLDTCPDPTEPFCKECMCTNIDEFLPALCTGTETSPPVCIASCPSDTFAFTNTTVNAWVIDCPAGYYKDITSKTCVECSKTCDVGYYISTTCDGTGSSDVACVACKTSCDVGYYISTTCDGTGSSDVTSCVACKTKCTAADKYLKGTCDGTGTSDLVCDKCTKNCKAGFYKASKCQVARDTECMPCKSSCAAGYYLKGASKCTGKTNTDPTECKACQVCPPGSYMSGAACTGMGKQDTVSCSVCKTSCSKGRILGGKACTGKTTSDTTVCSSCTPQVTCTPGKSVTSCIKGTKKLKCSACKSNYNKTKVGLCVKKKKK